MTYPLISIAVYLLHNGRERDSQGVTVTMMNHDESDVSNGSRRPFLRHWEATGWYLHCYESAWKPLQAINICGVIAISTRIDLTIDRTLLSHRVIS